MRRVSSTTPHADLLPDSYESARGRFRGACERVGLRSTAEQIGAVGPDGEPLTVDHVRLGSESPRRALVVLTGVHGVEAYAPSTALCRFVERCGSVDLGADLAVVLVHVVNPWGMAHDRRQNESNVDLNRNWGRDRGEPAHHDAYDEIHHLACPDTDEPPDTRDLLRAMRPYVDERGAEWVRNAITTGQYRHADGLHFGGDRLEKSTSIVERVVVPAIAGAEHLTVADLHTGHGRYGDIVTLCDRPAGSDQHRRLVELGFQVEATAARSDGTSRIKAGPIARGIADDVPGADALVATIEVGTADDAEQLGATHQEQWVYRRGGLHEPQHRAIRSRYRRCFTPDDPEWAQAAVDGLSASLDVLFDELLDQTRR